MFDPTVYENLKVVLEGAVYDLDLAGAVHVTLREDLLDLATLSRRYRIGFILAGEEAEAAAEEQPVSALLELSTDLRDLAAEILEQTDSAPGCSIQVQFSHLLEQADQEDEVCPRWEAVVASVWGNRFTVKQTLSYPYGGPGASAATRSNLVHLSFGRRFGEEVAEDLSRMVDHAVLTLQRFTGRE